MMDRRLIRAIVFLALVMVVIGGPAAAARQDAPPNPGDGAGVAFGVFPEGGIEGDFFEATVEPGGSHEFSLALLNAGAEPLALIAYPADVYSQTNGGLGVAFQDEQRTEATTWIDFPEGTLELAPGEQRIVPFTVNVPEGTAPGQHVAAIGVETADSFAIGDSGPFRQVLRKVIAIAIIVPGPVAATFELGAPELQSIEGQTVLLIPVTNTGNFRVRPTGPVVVRDRNGTELATGEAEMGSVYAGDTAAYELWMPISLPVDEYLVSADFIDPDTGAAASLSDVPVSLEPEPIETPVSEATPAPADPTPAPGPVSLQSVSVEPIGEPLQFANVAVIIENTGDHVQRSRVTLVVSRDGELIEEFVLDDYLPLPVGQTALEHRYIPPAGWESGQWTFGVIVHAISANADVETLLVSGDNVAEISVP